MISLRLEKDLEIRLDAFSRAKGLSRSAAIKKALTELLNQKPAAPDAYELGADLFDIAGSGQRDSSHKYKRRIKEHLDAKLSR